jgi:hypothetical protein
MRNLTSLETKLNNELTTKGYKATAGQLEIVCNSTHWLTNGKTFNQSMNAPMYMTEMVDNFLKFRNLSKFESDFNNK